MRKSNIAKRAFAAASVTLLATALALTGATGSAQAAPTKCNVTVIYNVPGFASTWCQTGKGYHRVVAYCAVTPGGRGGFFVGPWAGAGASSTAYCSKTWPYLVDAVIEKK